MKKKFFRFLKDKNVYVKYIKNLKKYRGEKANRFIDECINKHHNSRLLTYYAFPWTCDDRIDWLRIHRYWLKELQHEINIFRA